MTSQKQSQLTNEILQGNLVQLMFKLSIPSIAGKLILGLTPFIDALFAGQFIGKTAIGGITLALPFISILGGLTDLIGVGSASIFSRAIGSGDIKTQSKIFGNLVIMSVLISFVVTIFSYNFAEKLIVFMGGRGEMTSAGTEFLRIYVLGSVFSTVGIACNYLIKAEGKLRLSMIYATIYFVVNIILNTIFISIFHGEIIGLALATVIAMAAYCIGVLTYYLSGKSLIKLNDVKLTLSKNLIAEIISVGSSNFLVPMLGFIQSFVILKSIYHYGTQNDIAFFGATVTLTSLTFIPLNGFLQTLQPVIGINYGARNYDRIKKAYLLFIICATVLLTLFWLFIQLFPKIFLGLLLPNVNFSLNDLLNFRILNLLIPIMPIIPFGAILFQSIGKGQIVSLIVLLNSLLFSIPLILFFSKFMGVKGIYFAYIGTDLLVVLIALILTAKEFHKFNKMVIKTDYS
ncbi:MATE family efflux transporter [Nostoc sp.]|uniref:MATE family efflux transporter n=1 Tax=Nostoc sp. TaxID=1180 RepID=UPI002FFC3C40